MYCLINSEYCRHGQTKIFLCVLAGYGPALAGSLADGVLADVILITSHQLKEGKESTKMVQKLVTQKSFTSK